MTVTSDRANVVFLAALLGLAGGYLSWAGSIAASLPWWFGYVAITGAVINQSECEPGWRIFLSAAVSVAFFGLVSLFHLMFAGVVVISGRTFEIAKMGMASWTRIGILLAITFAAIVAAAAFRRLIVGQAAAAWRWSGESLTQVDGRIKLWGSVVLGVAAIWKAVLEG